MSSCRSKASWSIASDLLPKRALPLSADLLCKSPAGQWMFRQFLLQFLDLISLRLDLCRQQLTHCAQFSGGFGQGFEDLARGSFISNRPLKQNEKYVKNPYLIGVSGLCWPPRSLRCAPVNAFKQHRQLRRCQMHFAILAAGQTSCPFSRRFMNRQAP